MKTIDIGKDFTRFPSGRYKRNGATSGEEFRQRFLEDAVRNGEAILVKLDGTIGYGSSFLEEAFGGVVRSLRIDPNRVLSTLSFESDDSSLVDEIRQYILDAGELVNDRPR
jgi:hypothetical protein